MKHNPYAPLRRGCFYTTDLNSIWSLIYVTPPTISNSGTYYYTGGNRGPTFTDRGGSSYYTITNKSNKNVGTYTYRVALNNKTTCAWSTGGTADITGSYTIRYNTETLQVCVNSGGLWGYCAFTVTYVDENGQNKTLSYAQNALSTGWVVAGTVYPAKNSTVTYTITAINTGDESSKGIYNRTDERIMLEPNRGGRATLKNGTVTSFTGVLQLSGSQVLGYDAYGNDMLNYLLYLYTVNTYTQ